MAAGNVRLVREEGGGKGGKPKGWRGKMSQVGWGKERGKSLRGKNLELTTKSAFVEKES